MRFTVLDSWRGLCALWITLYHFRVVSHLGDTGFVHHGFIAVDFFFVLSGFVIAHAYGKGLSDGAGRLRFLIRRVGRLYPLHIVTLGVVVALEAGRLAATLATGADLGRAPFTGETSLPALAANLVLVHGLGVLRDFTWNVPSWSISVELALCFIYALASVWRRPLLTAALLAGGGLALLTWMGFEGMGEGRTALTRGVCGFFLGVLAQRAFGAWQARGWTMPGWVELASPLLVWAAIWLWDAGVWSGSALVFTVLVFIFAFERGPLSAAMRFGPLLAAGERSYSIYLVHYPLVLAIFGAAALAGSVTGTDLFAPGERLVLDFGGRWMGDLATLVFIAATVTLAGLTYRFIEVPWRDRFNRLSDRFR